MMAGSGPGPPVVGRDVPPDDVPPDDEPPDDPDDPPEADVGVVSVLPVGVVSVLPVVPPAVVVVVEPPRVVVELPPPTGRPAIVVLEPPPARVVVVAPPATVLDVWANTALPDGAVDAVPAAAGPLSSGLSVIRQKAVAATVAAAAARVAIDPRPLLLRTIEDPLLRSHRSYDWTPSSSAHARFD